MIGYFVSAGKKTTHGVTAKIYARRWQSQKNSLRDIPIKAPGSLLTCKKVLS